MNILSLCKTPLKPKRYVIGKRSAPSQPLGSMELSKTERSLPDRYRRIVRSHQDQSELEDVYRLVHDSYLKRGYCRPHTDRRLVHFPHLDGIPETTVLVAYENGRLLGTNSVTLDGPHGLHADTDFKAEFDAVRREGSRLAASWRIATCENLRHDPKLVMTLIKYTIDVALKQDVETCLFTFHPRHERIYRRLLRMDTLARCDATTGLSDAPAVLMRLDKGNIPSRWLS